MVVFSHVDMLNFNNIHFYINDIKIGDQQLPYRYKLKYSFLIITGTWLQQRMDIIKH